MRKSKENKEGVALVAVLGFLGVMLLMAVSLSIAMRTERLTSEAARDDMRTRQLVHTAIARAMGDVNDFMYDRDPTAPLTKNKWLYGAQAGSSVELPAMIHLPRDFALLHSLTPDTATNKLGSAANLISGEVIDWLPSKYLTTSGGDYDAGEKAADAHWINIIDPKTNVILGRIAYLIADCTGLLDVNLINDSGKPTRGEGVSIGEINAGLIPEVGTPERAIILDKNKTYYHRFDSLPEILYLNDGIGGGGAFKELAAVDPDALDNLVPYSLCYDRGWWKGSVAGVGTGTWVSTFADAPLNVNDWGFANAEDVFEALHFANPADMARCFEDYTDIDFIPGGTAGANPDVPCCEPIPMINEVSLRNEVNFVAGSGYTLDVYVRVEIVFPFPSSVTNATEYTLSFGAPYFTYTHTKMGFFGPLVPFNPNPPSHDFTVMSQPQYQSFTFQFRAGPINAPMLVPLVLQSPANSINNFNIAIAEKASGVVVDRMLLSANEAFSLSIPQIPLVAPWPKGASSDSLSANDPRLNHIPEKTCWVKGGGSMGSVNEGLTYGELQFNEAPNGAREGTNMYVRNGPMQSVAEMGFIPTGEPWGTIDLLSGQGADLLSKFRVEPLNAAPYMYGKINPHSLNTGVWSSVFGDCRMSEYPGDEGAKLVDVSLAGLLAKAITDYNAEDDSWGTNSFEGLADWLAIPALSRSGYDLWGAPNNNMQVEGVVRNSYRLFNPNQNLFTIIVVAQAVNDQPNDEGERGTFDEDTDTILGEKRALALVWRDPFPNAAGRNEMFIRMFRYIDQ